MEKRVKNLFDFNNYRLLISADFSARSVASPNYSLRSYARDLNISFSFLSEVINCKKHISSTKGREIFSKMGFDDEELDFIESLIVINNSTDNEKVKLATEVFNYYRTSTGLRKTKQKEHILKTPLHFYVFGLTRKFSDLETITGVLQQIGITKEQVLSTLSDFISCGYIKHENKQYIVTDPNFIIYDDNNYCEMIVQIIDLLLASYANANVNRAPDNAVFSLILSIDETNIKEIHDLNVFYFKTLIKLSNKVNNPKKMAFINNIYIEKIIPKNNLP